MKDRKIFEYRCSDLYLHHTLSSEPDPSDFSFKSHSHNMVEIYYFLRGNACFAIEGNVYELAPGNVTVMACGQTHNLLLSDSAPYERIALLLDPSLLSSEYELLDEAIHTGNSLFTLTEAEQIWFQQSIHIIQNAAESSRSLLIRHFAAALFTLLASKLDTQDRKIADSEPPAVKAVIEYINRHLADELSLDIIAKALYSNKVSLNRKFHEIMGCSIWEYILRRRTFAARQRLYFSGSISDAFEHSGFRDYSTFFRAYKKYVGLSPSEDLKKAK